jgi:hypothetical protein
MCSAAAWLRETQSSQLSQLPQQSVSSQGKKTRFRFSDAERIKCLKELFNTLCELEVETEDELWKNLHSVVCFDNPR